MKIAISQRGCSSALLADPTFCADWATLCRRCPWSTSYQSPQFVTAWYRIYAERFDPLLITARNDRLELVAILSLAVARGDGRIVFAGESQAEYQTWVCDPEIAHDFALEAMIAVRAKFPAATLEFRYLPPSVPLGWLEDRRLKGFALLTPIPRPIIRFAEIPTDPLAKSNNKIRLKRMQKRGELALTHLTGPTDLEAVIDELAHLHDLRHLAMYGNEPFVVDPLKKSFWLELMKSPGLLHLTTLRVGDQLASVHVNICDGKQLHLDLLAHNSILAKYSPGKFHIHLLSQMLHCQGFLEIDLTPGGDPYKERFASTHDTAHAFSFFPTRRDRFKACLRARADYFARKAMNVMRAHPARVKAAWKAATELSADQIVPAILTGIATRIARRLPSIIHVATIPKTDAPDLTCGLFNVDNTRDLMAYRAAPGDISRRRFLSAALERFEEGQHLFSHTEDGRLLQIGWLIERPSDVFLSRICPGLILPHKHALITSFATFCAPRKMELTAACIDAMFNNLRCRGVEGVAMIVPSDQTDTIRLLKSAGFRAEPTLKYPGTKAAPISAAAAGRIRVLPRSAQLRPRP